jgi:hypothetical protein
MHRSVGGAVGWPMPMCCQGSTAALTDMLLGAPELSPPTRFTALGWGGTDTGRTEDQAGLLVLWQPGYWDVVVGWFTRFADVGDAGVKASDWPGSCAAPGWAGG